MNATSRVAVIALAVLLPLAATAALPEGVFTYSGYLRSGGGAPETSAQTMSFALYDVESGGTALWTQTLSVAPDAQGWFTAVLGGAGHALPPAQLASQLWLGIKVDAEPEMAPRTKVGLAPLALAVDWGGVLNRPAACATGQFVAGYDPASGAALCAAPAAAGGVTSVSGSGVVTAAPTSGAVTVSLSGCGSAGQILQWSGSAWQCVALPSGGGGVTSVGAAAPLVTSGGSSPVISLTTSCSPGQILQWSGSAWQCVALPSGGGGVTSVGAAAPLVSSGGSSPVLSLTTGCAAGQLLKWDGATWACGADANAGGTITGVNAGSGLSGGGSSGAVSLAVNLATAGGTNGTATTVARSDHRHAPTFLTYGAYALQLNVTTTSWVWVAGTSATSVAAGGVVWLQASFTASSGTTIGGAACTGCNRSIGRIGACYRPSGGALVVNGTPAYFHSATTSIFGDTQRQGGMATQAVFSFGSAGTYEFGLCARREIDPATMPDFADFYVSSPNLVALVY